MQVLSRLITALMILTLGGGAQFCLARCAAADSHVPVAKPTCPHCEKHPSSQPPPAIPCQRCQVAGHPMMADYNDFVQSNRSAISAMNDRLKAHFIHSFGPVGGQRAYDSFTTSMANGYGAASSGADVCGDADSLAREGAALHGSVEGLMLLAERQGLVAKLPEGLCAGAARTQYASVGGTPETVRR